MKKYLKEIFKRKDLIFYLVTSGLKAQHRNSYLGYLWWLLDPLLGALIYYFVVVVVFQRGKTGDYGVYLIIGLIVWQWLSSTIITSSKSIVSQAGIISQIYLPKTIFPLGATLTQLVNFGFGLIIIAIFLIFSKVIPGFNIVWLPFIMIMQLFFMLAITLPIAFLCVFVRDIDNLVGHILRLWFFSSPVIWSSEMIPEKLRFILDMNPMFYFLEAYRNVLLYNSSPQYLTLSLLGTASILILFCTVGYYNRHEYKIIKAL
jgi:ABC-type polysaccharide/polyol phosphate export permease